ncbi:DUF424 domain-containing protein [Candidatus Woesearchaeota archaeon]|nr:DUF424 domain-containing protein [Candidatus Woesearchaeota archaeon]
MPGTFIVAQHNSEGRLILTVCDKEVRGKRLEDKEAVLDLNSKFYHGEEKDAKVIEKLMLRAYTIHVVGKNAVALAIKLGLAAKENVKTVDGVPHVQVLML